MQKFTTPAATPTTDTDPRVQLVGFDGHPIEAPHPKLTRAHSWPRWTDAIVAQLGASDDELERHKISIGFGDAATHVVWKADTLGRIDIDEAFEAAWEQAEREEPVPAEIPDRLIDPTQPDDLVHDDDDPTGEFPPVVVDLGAVDDDLARFEAVHPVRTSLPFMVAPIRGGSPEADSSASAIDLGRIGALSQALYGDRPTAAD